MGDKTKANLADVMLSERTRIITQATEPNRTHGVDMGVLTCLHWGRQTTFLTSAEGNFRRYLPVGSTLQNPFQAYVLCDGRSEGCKVERRGDKVPGPRELQFSDVTSLRAGNILPSHGRDLNM